MQSYLRGTRRLNLSCLVSVASLTLVSLLADAQDRKASVSLGFSVRVSGRANAWTNSADENGPGTTSNRVVIPLGVAGEPATRGTQVLARFRNGTEAPREIVARLDDGSETTLVPASRDRNSGVSFVTTKRSRSLEVTWPATALHRDEVMEIEIRRY